MSSRKKESKSPRTKKYTENDLNFAIKIVREGKMSANRASNEFKIPKGTLINKLHQDSPSNQKKGPATILLPKEEELIKNWIIDKARLGFPMHPEDVKDAVQKIVVEEKRPNPFTNNRPGKKWFSLFLQRNPDIALKNTEILSKARASVTEEHILNWFEELLKYLKEEEAEDLLNDPRRILNLDELGMLTCPKTGRLLGPRGEKNLYRIAGGPEKQSISVLCTFSGDGTSYDPMIIYPYKRNIPREIKVSIPDGYSFGISDSGWITSATYYEYIANVLYPRLVEKEVDFPVLVLFDGHKSHINMELHLFCMEHKLLLYCLYPNATHIIQPCDVGIFRPLKIEWKKIVAKHSQSTTQSITKFNFAPLFQTAFEKAITPRIIQNAFAACGLYPLNPSRVDYSKCISTRRKNLSCNNNIADNTNIENNSSLSINKTCLKILESKMPEYLVHDFQQAYSSNDSVSSEIILFNIWTYLKDSITINHNEEGTNTDSEEKILKNEIISDENVLVLGADATNDIVADLLLSKDKENSDTIVNEVLSFEDDLNNNDILIFDAVFTKNLSLVKNNSFGQIDKVIQNPKPEKTIQPPINDETIVRQESSIENNILDKTNALIPNCKLENHLPRPVEGKIIAHSELKNVNRDEIWKKHLHFPSIEESTKKVKKETIFAITSQKWRELEMEKMQLEIEEKKLKQKKQAERLIKQEEKEKEKVEREKKKEERLLKKQIQEQEKLVKKLKKEEIKAEKEKGSLKKPKNQIRRPKKY
nr:ORF42 [Bracoviriform inaniti]